MSLIVIAPNLSDNIKKYMQDFEFYERPSASINRIATRLEILSPEKIFIYGREAIEELSEYFSLTQRKTIFPYTEQGAEMEGIESITEEEFLTRCRNA